MDNTNYSPKLIPTVVKQQLLAKTPFMLFDIGCREGIDSAWRSFGDDLHAHAFDPQQEECARLTRNETNPNIHYHAAYVGLPVGHPFRQARAARRASNPFRPFYERSSTYMANLRTQCDPLKISESSLEAMENERKQHLFLNKISIAEFAARSGIEDIDFVKIDTDGDDFEVALSCQELMRPANILGFLIESSFVGSHHETENSFHNVDRFMKQNGFLLFGLSAYKYSRAALPAPFLYKSLFQTVSGQPMWGDMIYLRDAASRDYPLVWGAELSVPKLLKLACLFELFQLPDCAAELVVNYKDKLQAVIDPTMLLDLLTPPFQGRALSYSEYLRLFDENVEAFLPPG